MKRRGCRGADVGYCITRSIVPIVNSGTSRISGREILLQARSCRQLFSTQPICILTGGYINPQADSFPLCPNDVKPGDIFEISARHSHLIVGSYARTITIQKMAPQLGSGAVVIDEKSAAGGAASAASDVSNASSTHETVPVSNEPRKTWRSYVWDTFDKSPEERRFLFKLDAVILTFASLGT
jgi:hypothetical protein